MKTKYIVNNVSGQTINGDLAITGSISASTMYGSNISDTLYSVYYGLDASGTTATTESICSYGINVFTGVTSTDYATKLPQPVTGKSVKIINLSLSVLLVFPSNDGGSINNLPVNQVAQIPPDGKPYEFFCIKNPLPGAWTFSAPAIAQYDSGEIVVPFLSGSTGFTEQGISAADSNNFGVLMPFESSNWCYDGHSKPLIVSESYDGKTFVFFKPTTAWMGIAKIKVYTNLSACAASGTTGESQFALMGSFGINYYNFNTMFHPVGEFIDTGAGGSGRQTPYGYCNQVIGGIPLLPNTSVQDNIGDPATLWGELTTGLSPIYPAPTTTVGDVYLGQVVYPYNFPNDFIGETVDVWGTGYLSFQLRPLNEQPWDSITNLKVRFIIEYF